MNDRETRRYDMFGRSLTFGTLHDAEFAVGGEAKKHFGLLAAVKQGVNEAKAGQLLARNTALEVLYDAIRLDLGNIRRTATAIDQDEPGFAHAFPAPESNSHADLRTAAGTYLAALHAQDTDPAAQKAAKTALAARFIAHELPADFVTDLAEDLAAIDEEKNQMETGDSESVESTAAVGRLIRDGMKAVTYLDAIMRNKYARNADVLRAWESATHIERAPVREKKAKAVVENTKS